MDVQQSRGYYWTQGDFCRAIFSALFTGVFSYLVHLSEWGDETSEMAIHKRLKWKISTEVAWGGGKKKKQRKSPHQRSWGPQREAVKCLLRKLGWAFFSRALRCQCDAVSMWVGVSQGLAWQKIALCWNVARWASRAHRGWILIESRCLISSSLYKTAVDN